MRSYLITLAAASIALLLSGCPDIPGGPAHQAQSARASHPAGVAHEGDTPAGYESSVHAGTAGHRSISEIAFARHSCPDSHPRRTLFSF